MNLKQAARRLGIHYQTAYKLVRSGRIVAVRVGGSYEISEAALERYLAEREAMRRAPIAIRDEVRAAPRDDLGSLLERARDAYDAVVVSARPTLELAADGLATTIGDLAVIRPASRDGRWLLPGVVAHSDVRARSIATAAMEQYPHARPSGVLGDVLRSGTVFTPHVAQDRVRAQVPAELHQFLDQVGVHSLISVPAECAGEIVGMVTVTRDAPGRPYTRDDVAIVEQVAAVAGAALMRARTSARAWNRRIDLMTGIAAVLEHGDGWGLVDGLLDQGAIGELVCGHSGRVIAVNEAAAALIGRAREQILGAYVADLMDDDERAAESAALERLLCGELTYLDDPRAIRSGAADRPTIGVSRGVVRNAMAEPRAVVFVLHPIPQLGAAAAAGSGPRPAATVAERGDGWAVTEAAGHRRAS